MQRPYVQLRTTNSVNHLRQHLAALLPMFEALPGVVGITLNGGMARGYADHLSEIDLTIYLQPTTYQLWQSGHAPIPLGIAVLEGALYDLKIIDFQAEQAAVWESDKLWDASYAEILYDPEGQIAQLIQAKVAQFPQPAEAEGALFNCWWYFRLAGDIWIHREDVLQGHLMFNQAVISLLKALFIANQEFIPHEKWLIHMSRSLAWQPNDWEARLQAAMSTGDMTISSLKQRQIHIAALWTDVDAYILQICAKLPVHVMQKTFYTLLAMLAEKQTVTMTEWQTMASLEMLNRPPFYGLVAIVKDTIVLDRAKLLRTKPEALYAWHYEILSAVKDLFHPA
jgi:hypothetical protein